ncbi:hypothetical protein CEXT_341601 [Caerostris extrusa]|uniref:Uncharacterized protein n=1 Tax=Caerostris extrusa TaxID=172846 RepID=A0AAV4SIA2_CAEEX|nr:hypothetical protein CEXT_341601 [Caerostris extrusa]
MPEFEAWDGDEHIAVPLGVNDSVSVYSDLTLNHPSRPLLVISEKLVVLSEHVRKVLKNKGFVYQTSECSLMLNNLSAEHGCGCSREPWKRRRINSTPEVSLTF